MFILTFHKVYKWEGDHVIEGPFRFETREAAQEVVDKFLPIMNEQSTETDWVSANIQEVKPVSTLDKYIAPKQWKEF